MRKAVLTAVETCVNLCKAMKRSTTYVPVAQTAGTFSGGSELAEALGVGHANDFHAGAPVRASLVCGKHTGIPGPGYFTMARQLGALKSTSLVDEFLHWKGHMDALGVDLTPEAKATGTALGLVL
jgi:hypothetical protein